MKFSTKTQLYDLRQKRSAHTLTHTFPVLSVAFGIDGDVVYTAGVDNDIQVGGTCVEF